MKKFLSILCVLAILATFGVFALGSSESEPSVVDQGNANGDTQTAEDEASAADSEEAEDPTAIGDYKVDIKSYRLAKDYEGKDVIIVTYGFTNVSHSEPISFSLALEDTAFQNDIGLNESFLVDESYNYSSDTQLKDIKAGASLDVEIAYDLDDTASDVVIEICELFSLEDKTLTKTFTLA